jgi:alkaline phosphatase
MGASGTVRIIKLLFGLLGLVALGCADERPPTVYSYDGWDGGYFLPVDAGPPRYNVLLFIMDGVGPAQLQAARLVKQAPLHFDRFPAHVLMTTEASGGVVTDSGAAATAMATGRKVTPYTLGVALPGSGRPLVTALELRQRTGVPVGVATVETPLVDATPSAFVAHQASRFDEAGVASDYLRRTRPDLMAGGTSYNLGRVQAVAAGYVAIDSEAAMAVRSPGVDRVAWLFDEARPRLPELTRAALGFMSRGKPGFFLLVETEATDTHGHANNLDGVVKAVLELDQAVAEAMAWMGNRTDTLIIVTSDHETGGLVLDEPVLDASSDSVLQIDSAVEDALSPFTANVPPHHYTTTSHSSRPVDVFATGAAHESVLRVSDNTHLFGILAP